METIMTGIGVNQELTNHDLSQGWAVEINWAPHQSRRPVTMSFYKATKTNSIYLNEKSTALLMSILNGKK